MNRLKRWAALFSALLAISTLAFAAVTVVQYFGTGTNSTTSIFKLDDSGNLTILGTLASAALSAANETVTGVNTVSGTSVFTPSIQSSIGNFTVNAPILPTASYIQVETTGTAVNFTATTAISTATAVNGQFIIVGSTVSAAGTIVQITTGTATGVVGDDAVIVISSTKSAVGFIYNSALSQWSEVGRQ